MSDSKPSWSQGLEILRTRQRDLPQTIFRSLTDPIDFSQIDFSKYRSILTTGIGSSAAHARYQAWLFQKYCRLAATDVSAGAFLNPPGKDASEQALIVFSQGLAPNARIPLSVADRFGSTILVTAATAEHGERAEALQRARDAGVVIIPMPIAPEYEVLLRITGPAAGYAVALRMASHCGGKIEFNPNSVVSAVQDAFERVERLLAGVDSRLFSDPITFIGSGGYTALALNLCSKVVEGMFLPYPAAVDALELAHGWLQEASGKRRTFIGLTRHSPYEDEMFARVRAVLEPQHRWFELEARLPEPLHIFEHEAGMNALVLSSIAMRRLDQLEWPAKGSDSLLYGIGSIRDLEKPIEVHSHRTQKRSRCLEELTWPEIEVRINAGQRTVVLPLGAIEQHGHHLPLAVDSIIAGALAERFCERVPEALQAPTLRIGCSSEHMDFCGTLSLASATLQSLIRDVASSLIRHGFTHVVIFSAHGGNDALLAEMKPALQKWAVPAKITVVHGIDQLSRVWSDASGAEGVAPEVSGAHAGEFESSIIAGLHPTLVRWQEVRAGVTSLQDDSDSQNVFYPSLRKNAPDGVVGDPRAASAERSERYLSAWVDFIVKEYQQTAEASIPPTGSTT